MRTPLNKSRAPDNKAHTSANKSLSVGTLTPRAEQIQPEDPRTVTTTARPNFKRIYLAGIAEAQREQLKAAEAKNSAQTEEEYKKACEDEANAKQRENLFRRRLEEIERRSNGEED